MSSGIEQETPEAVKIFWARERVKLERGDLECADTYFLAKLIMYGNEDEKLVANDAWKKRIGKPFPYHPSFKRNKYPIGRLAKWR